MQAEKKKKSQQDNVVFVRVQPERIHIKKLTEKIWLRKSKIHRACLQEWKVGALG